MDPEKIVFKKGLPVGMFRTYEFTMKQAKRGDTRAQFEIAMLFYNGNIAQQDFAKAAYWFEKAAEAGITEAMTILGKCYLEGMGVGQDREKGLSLLSKAAGQGDAAASAALEEAGA